MKIKPIITSLSIKKLFGEHDVNITFKNPTVIVGKNGLGKTTILKIIDGLVTGKNHFEYSKICESIELTFSNGKSFCFGDYAHKHIKNLSKESAHEFFTKNNSVKSDLMQVIINNPRLKDIASEELLATFINAFLNNETHFQYAKDKIFEKYNNTKEAIFVDKPFREDFNKKNAIRYISTVNISANAGNSMDIGNSIEKNILDLAIHEELRLLLKNSNKTAINKFEKQLNIFLRDSHKKARLDHNDWVYITDSNSLLKLSQLSSGERQLIYILATVANTYGKPTLLLMDEPEVSMHLSWQEKIIDAIMSINPKMQVIAVTHSPGIIINGHMDAYVEMKDIIQESKNV